MTNHDTRKKPKKGLALLGTVIMVATFIAKEGFADSLKDTVAGIEAATANFALRESIAFNANRTRISCAPTLREN